MRCVGTWTAAGRLRALISGLGGTNGGPGGRGGAGQCFGYAATAGNGNSGFAGAGAVVARGEERGSARGLRVAGAVGAALEGPGDAVGE